MTISINPYADVLNFPPGTPASVINAVLMMNARNQQMKNQPSWWEQGFQDILGGATKNLLFPWLQNEFVNLPYQTDLSHMKTEDAIRQAQAEGQSRTDQLFQQAINKQSLEQGNISDFGSALGMFGDITSEMTQPGVSTPNSQYGPYADTYSAPPTAPGDVSNFPDITQMQGDLVSTGQPPTQTFTPPAAPPGQPILPSSADVFRTMSGRNPLYAGLMGEAYAKNTNISSFLDPLQTSQREAKLRQSEATIQDIMSKTGARDAQVQATVNNLVAKGQLTQAQADLVLGKAEEQGARNMVINNASTVDEVKDLLFKNSSKDPRSATMFQAQVIATRSAHPDWSEGQVMSEALAETKKFQVDKAVTIAQLGSAARMPAQIAATELPKIDMALRQTESFDKALSNAESALNHLKSYGFLAEDGTYPAGIKAAAQRSFNSTIWNSKGIQDDVAALRFLTNALQVGYDRTTLGDQGARIKAAFNLPEDPLTTPVGVYLGQFRILRETSDSDRELLTQMRQTLIQASGAQIPFFPGTGGLGLTGPTTSGPSFGPPTPNARRH